VIFLETIWIVRHGQSRLNKQNRFAGSTNCSLTVEGKNNSKRLGCFFKSKGVSFQKIYSSPMTRALQSARIICKQLKFPVNRIIIENRIREQDFGAWEKRTRKQVEKQNPGIIAAWLADPYSVEPKNGENYFDLENRLLPFLKKLKLSGEKTVLIVTHANIIKVILQLLLLPKKIDVRAIDVEYNTIYRFSVKEKRLESFTI
jgi:probable phosphoglycerate mutase